MIQEGTVEQIDGDGTILVRLSDGSVVAVKTSQHQPDTTVVKEIEAIVDARIKKTLDEIIQDLSARLKNTPIGEVN